MPPQIKQDLNRSGEHLALPGRIPSSMLTLRFQGWETTDFPSVCENCLPDNPYVQMLKNDHGKLTRLLLLWSQLTIWRC